MQQYLDLLYQVRHHGTVKTDRTGTGTHAIFGHQMRFDLSQGFPLLTTKKLHLQDNKVSIWDEWATEEGELGPVYGEQWRSWKGPNGEVIDQISQVIEAIKTQPDSRRLVVTAWNPAVLPDTSISPRENAALGRQALPPCHCLFQFYVADGKLSCQLYQRSGDIFLGVPFNIASYSLLTLMVAQACGLEPGDFVHTLGDAHLYSNHLEQADEQLSRTPGALPKVRLNPEVTDVFAFRFEDIEVLDYAPQAHIKAPVAI